MSYHLLGNAACVVGWPAPGGFELALHTSCRFCIPYSEIGITPGQYYTTFGGHYEGPAQQATRNTFIYAGRLLEASCEELL